MNARAARLALLLACAPALARAADAPPLPLRSLPPLPVEPPSRPRFSFKVQAGPSLRQIYGVGIYGVDFGVAIGADVRRLGVHAVVEGFAGATGFGLTTGQLRVGVSVEGRVDRVRFGAGPMIGALWMKRVTRGTNIQDLTIGPEVHLTVDVLRFGEHALYAGARGALDLLASAVTGNTGTPLVYELALLVGLRL